MDMILIILMVVGTFLIANHVSIESTDMDDKGCRHVTITRALFLKIYDGPVCGDEKITINGKNISPDDEESQ